MVTDLPIQYDVFTSFDAFDQASLMSEQSAVNTTTSTEERPAPTPPPPREEPPRNIPRKKMSAFTSGCYMS